MNRSNTTGCVLTRLGNKRRIAGKIIPFFPEHRLYVEPFFGAGGLFFNKLKSEYNLLNDKDEEVFNLWQVVMDRPDELVELWSRMPVDQKLFLYWKRHKETDPLRRALRFLLLSNFGVLGKPQTMRVFNGNAKRNVVYRIHNAQRMLGECEILCQDFRKVLQFVGNSRLKKDAFVYCDPPYLGTGNNYAMDTFTERDSAELFDLLEGAGVRWAMSEFDHPFILNQAIKRRLRVEEIGERQNLNNRRTEILVMNY